MMTIVLRILALAFVAAACRSPADCPPASEIAGARAETEIIAAHCREDGWTQRVADCLREAKTEIAAELCLKQLTMPQQRSLREGLAELGAEHDRAESVAAIASFERGLAELDLSSPVKECTEVTDALATLKSTVHACKRADGLELYSRHQLVVANLRELRAKTKTCDQIALAIQKLAVEPCK